jgi:hypothetical protein
MIIQIPEEIAYLKNSEQLLQKIENIKTMLHEINCTAGISSIRLNDNILRLNLDISFPVN